MDDEARERFAQWAEATFLAIRERVKQVEESFPEAASELRFAAKCVDDAASIVSGEDE